MTEKIIYVSKDDIDFDSKEYCQQYEKDYDILDTVELSELGESIAMKDTLTSIQHTRQNINKVIDTLIMVFENNIQYQSPNIQNVNEKRLQMFKNYYNEVKKCTDSESVRKAWDKFCKYGEILSPEYSYNHEIFITRVSNKFRSVMRRLKYISYVTCIEYPDSYWVNQEIDFEIYCKKELKRIKENLVNCN